MSSCCNTTVSGACRKDGRPSGLVIMMMIMAAFLGSCALVVNGLELRAQLGDDGPWPAKRCTNVSGGLNVRDSNGRVVSSLGPETQVTVYGITIRDGTRWAKIDSNEYVAADYLKLSCSGSSSLNNAHYFKPFEVKSLEALEQVFISEGKCQNWKSDSGNLYQGSIGYTCMGVIPAECWENRNGIFAPLLSGFNGIPADFCKYAYDKNSNTYKVCASKLYQTKYFKVCENLPQPAFYVCGDIAINSGNGRATQYLNEFGGYKNQDPKAFARKLNERHREDYKKWGAPGTANNKFLNGWLARADSRAHYIDNY